MFLYKLLRCSGIFLLQVKKTVLRGHEQATQSGLWQTGDLPLGFIFYLAGMLMFVVLIQH